VLNQVAQAGQHFLSAATEVRPWLNKARLFSWLVYTHARLFVQGDVDVSFVFDFEDERRHAKTSLRALLPEFARALFEPPAGTEASARSDAPRKMWEARHRRG
jgi:hypothetical protein